jgi:hypothetical protein
MTTRVFVPALMGETLWPPATTAGQQVTRAGTGLGRGGLEAEAQAGWG